MKDWNEVICTKCGLINDYTITEKSGQSVCTCNCCGHFLGNKPKPFDVRTVVMPFGKYVGQMISQVNDLPYFRWVLDNTRVSGSILAAIEWKLNIKK